MAMMPLQGFSKDLSGIDLQQYHRKVFERWHQDKGFNARSTPNRGFDFYTDCLGRHVAENQDALRFYEGQKRAALTYADLQGEVRRCAETWQAQGVQFGDSVAVLAATPVRRTIALLAGFRLGVKLSLLPMTGSSLLGEHLEVLDCDHLHIETGFLSWVPEAFKSRVIRQDRQTSLTNEEPSVYLPQDIVLRLLDPYSQEGETVLEIPAEFLFQRLLQDAVIILGLERGQVVAGMSAVMNGVAPFPELACLLSGACYWFLESSDWQQNALNLLSEPLDLIAIPAQSRSALLKAGMKVEEGAWKRWIRNPIECLDYQSWRDFVTALGLDAVPHADLLYTCHMAGIALGNEWSLDLLKMDLLPPAGTEWQLGDLMDPTLPSPINHGRFAARIPTEEGEAIFSTPFMLTPFDGAYRFVGHYPPGRQGRAFPSARLVEVLSFPGALHAIVEKPGAQGVESKTFFVLVAFQDTRSEDEIRLLIIERMGESALPDEIFMSPLFPRLTAKGQVDRDWVTRLFFRGEFTRREDLPFYRAMARLKAEIYQRLGPRPASNP